MSQVGNEERPRNVEVSVSVEQSAHAVDEEQLSQAVTVILHDSRFDSAAISVAIVDDTTIHDLNRRYLQHDYPTDVLSFVLDNDGDHLEGEIVISADTSARVAEELGWPSAAEQLLYVIHGTLHLIGYNDKSPTEAAEMKAEETRYLARFGYGRLAELAQEGSGSTSDAPYRAGAVTK